MPHGAYQDSGRVAAAAFALLQAQYGDARPLRTIILGTNHFILQPAACLSSAQSWATPLGSMLVDAELNAELNLLGIPYSDGPHRRAHSWAAHNSWTACRYKTDGAGNKEWRSRPSSAFLLRRPEHSIENQLPFLQHVTGMHCQIAPVSVGWLGGLDEVERVAAAVVAALRRHPPGAVLLLATNDFTHAVGLVMPFSWTCRWCWEGFGVFGGMCTVCCGLLLPQAGWQCVRALNEPPVKI